MGSTHREFGVAVVLGVALAQGWPPLQAGAGLVVALGVSGGRLSPDMDQYRGWRLGDKVLPDEALGHGGPLQHRGITHWWGLPVAAVPLVALVPPGYRWIAVAALAAWVSHLVGDLLFGKACVYAHRGPGIPLAPWWGHVGLGLDAGGTVERLVRDLLLPAVVVWQAVMVVNADGPILDFLRGLSGG